MNTDNYILIIYIYMKLFRYLVTTNNAQTKLLQLETLKFDTMKGGACEIGKKQVFFILRLRNLSIFLQSFHLRK